jgi:hypothetical protein
MAGKMRKTSGKRILTGAFWARSSADARRRLRISVASERRMSPIETPRVSPCVTARTKDRTAGVSARISMFRSASSVVRPMFCSWRVRRSSSPNGPSIRSEATCRDPEKPRPASTVTTSRSTSSGSS